MRISPLTAFVVAVFLFPGAARGQDSAGRVALAVDGPQAPDAPASISRDAAGRATLRAPRLTQDIAIDGTLDEAFYERIAPIGDFVQYEPANGAPATEQ